MIIDLSRRWRSRAACAGVGTDLFFTDHAPQALEDPGAKLQAEWDRAKRVCMECPVITECGRDYLGETEGVWGGMDPAQRHRVRRKLGAKLHTMTGPKEVEYAKLAYDLRESGVGMAEVARLIGVSVAVATYLDEWYKDHLSSKAPKPEVSRDRGFRRTVTDNQIKQIVALRRGGLTFGEIATRMGCSEYTVRRYVHQQGEPQLSEGIKRGSRSHKVSDVVESV